MPSRRVLYTLDEHRKDRRGENLQFWIQKNIQFWIQKISSSWYTKCPVFELENLQFLTRKSPILDPENLQFSIQKISSSWSWALIPQQELPPSSFAASLHGSAFSSPGDGQENSSNLGILQPFIIKNKNWVLISFRFPQFLRWNNSCWITMELPSFHDFPCPCVYQEIRSQHQGIP